MEDNFAVLCECFLIRDLKEECCQSLSANLAVDQVINWLFVEVTTQWWVSFFLYRWLTFWSSLTCTRLWSWKPQLYHFFLHTKRRSSANLTGRLSWRWVVWSYFIVSKPIYQGHPDLLLEVLESSVESRGLPPPRLMSYLNFVSLPLNPKSPTASDAGGSEEEQDVLLSFFTNTRYCDNCLAIPVLCMLSHLAHK